MRLPHTPLGPEHAAPYQACAGPHLRKIWRAMANTYSQIYIQIVFVVQGRQNLIRPERKEELQKT